MTTPNKKPDDDLTRRAWNLEVGRRLMKAGIPIFVSYDKTSIIPKWQRLDSELTEAEREEARQKRKREGKTTPTVIGSTLNGDTWERMQRLVSRKGTASICCGLAKIAVIDADITDGKQGVELFEAFVNEHGGLPEGTLVLSSRSGGKHYVFADREGKFGNHEGGLSKLDCNVRGRGGQIVAPSSIRADGKTYGVPEDLARFIAAIKDETLPELPQCLADLIGDPSGSASLNDSDPRIQAGIAELTTEEWPEFAGVFGPGKRLDVEKLKNGSEKFRNLMDDPGANRSSNRLSLASALKGASSRTSVRDYATFCGEYPEIFGELVDKHEGPGTYDVRNVAKDFATATRAEVQSNSEAMGAVDVEADEQAETQAKQSRREALIEHLEGAIAIADLEDNAVLVSALEVELKRVKKRADSEGAADHISLTNLLSEPATYTQWVVKHFVAFRSTIIAAGLWGSGKTAVYLDIALHIAHGLPWRGRKVKKGVVVYVGLENPTDVQSRVRAWCQKYKDTVQPEDSFVMFRGNCTLFDARDKATKDEQRIVELANQTAAKLNLPVALVVIDTVSQAIIPGSDREHGSLFVRSMQRIADATGANVTALHHPTKQGDEVRGDGAFQGNTDGVVLLSRNKQTGVGTIKASAQKFRVGDPRQVNFGYKLDPVVVGKDADGEDIKVVVAVEAPGVAWNVDESDGASDVDENIPLPPDAPNDRPAAILRTIRERVELIATNTGDASEAIELPVGEILKLWNVDRKRSGLPEISEPAICSRLLARLVENGELVRVGDSRRSTAYKLAH